MARKFAGSGLNRQKTRVANWLGTNRRFWQPAAFVVSAGSAALIDIFIAPLDSRTEIATPALVSLAVMFVIASACAVWFASWRQITAALALLLLILALVPAYAYFADADLFREVLPKRAMALVLLSVVIAILLYHRNILRRLAAAKEELEHRVEERTAMYRGMVAAAEDAQEKLASIMKVAFDGVVVSENGTIVDCNESFCRALGYSQEEFLNSYTLDHVAAPFRGFAIAEFRAPTGQPYELMLRRKDGSTVRVETYSAQLNTERLDLHICGIRDIGRRLELEREVIDVSEKARTRVGVELHDNLGQMLTSALWSAQLLEKKLEALDINVTDHVRRISSILEESMEQCLRLSDGLAFEAPGVAELGSMLAEYVRDTDRHTPLECQLRFDLKEGSLRPESAIHIYRIVEEAVVNSVKHSQGSRVDISLREFDGEIVLEVTDDGPSSYEDSEKGRGAGIRNMAYRARLLGGIFSIAPGSQGGTRVSCTFFPEQGGYQQAG